MKFWSKLTGFLHLSSSQRTSKTSSETEEVDYGDRIKPPNGVFGRGAGDRSLNMKDMSNPASPFSPLKKDRW